MVSRIIYFCVLASVINISIGQQFQCPLDESSNPIDGTFPDPNYCNIYYHCVGGVAFAEQCPPGLVFTVKLRNCRYSLCVHPDFAECPETAQVLFDTLPNKPDTFEKSQQVAKSNKGESLNDFECNPAVDGTFPNPKDCRQYYHCVEGRAWPHQCPSDYAFSPTLNIRDCNVKICVPRAEAKCPLNGGWSEWSEFGECFPNCGNGVKARFRECNNPPPANGGAQCEGNNVDIVECTEGDCSSNYPAFFVSNRRAQVLASTKHTFDKVYINNNNIFNSTTSVATFVEPGYFWFTLVVTATSYRGRENFRATSSEFWRNLEGSGVITDEINSIQLKQSSSQLFRYSHSRIQVIGSEDGAETSWLGYKIDSSSLLFAQRTSAAVSGVIRFDRLRISQNITGTSNFLVSREGYYYIAFSFRQTSSCALTLRINQQPVNEMSIDLPISRTSRHDMNSKSLIVKLNAGDNFEMYVQNGLVQSDGDRQITLSAYRLNKVSHVVTAVRNSRFSSASFVKLSFDNVLHNLGNSWDSENNEFVCNGNGIYKVSLSAGLGIGVQTFIEIMVNGKVESRLSMTRTVLDRSRFISRTSLINLKINDKVNVRVLGLLDPSITNSVLNIIRISN